MSIFNGQLFNPEWKTKVHLGQFAMVAVIIALAIGKIVTRPSHIPMNRMDMIGITMGGKTILVLAYQLLTEHVSRLQKWGSLRAYAILNSLEVVFWLMVVVLTLWGISIVCVGISCGLGWLVAFMALVMALVCFWTATVSWKEFRQFKRFGNARSEALPQETPYSMSGYSSSTASMIK